MEEMARVMPTNGKMSVDEHVNENLLQLPSDITFEHNIEWSTKTHDIIFEHM